MSLLCSVVHTCVNRMFTIPGQIPDNVWVPPEFRREKRIDDPVELLNSIYERLDQIEKHIIKLDVENRLRRLELLKR